jgi:serine/threonine-protein kinase
MSSKVTFKIVKGDPNDREFVYEQRETVIIGRDKNCAIRFDENAISRYHCYIEINPPAVTVRDLGSLNGTFLNGEKIGQRDPEQSPEEARKIDYSNFLMKSGDSLRLGKSCEIVLKVEQTVVDAGYEGEEETTRYAGQTVYENPLKDKEQPQKAKCAECNCEIEEPRYKNDAGQPLCKSCHTKQEKLRVKKAIEALKIQEAAEANESPEVKPEKEAKRKAEEEAKRRGGKDANRRAKNKCTVCGTPFEKAPNGINICPQCQKDPVKLMAHLFKNAANKKDDAGEIAGYRNIKLLGKGGMGQVWLVEDEQTGEQMALKVMLPEVARDELSKKMFLREAQIGCALKHESIVRHYKCGQSDEMFFILMELCKGGSVDQMIDSRGGSMGCNEKDLACATSIILQVLDGLYHTHNATTPVTLRGGRTVSMKGVVHRDFKPANIFIANEDHSCPVAKVADFGLAKAFDASGYTDITKPRDIRGTLAFMPRQQIIDCKYAHPEIDAWAAAASYYNMLTGLYPKNIRGQSSADFIRIVLEEDPVPVRRRNPAIPEKLARVIDAALIDNPKIGVHKLKDEYGKKFDSDYPETLVLKKMIWEALPSNLQKNVWDILPSFTKKNIER